MEILLSSAIPSSAFLKITTANSKPLKARAAVCCLGFEGHENPTTSEETLQSTESIPEKKHNDIWRLFREAQQNIMLLNKQRMMAMEELDKTKREKKFLLDKIEQLEMKQQPSFGKAKLSIRSELLLRIDSMILTGMIGIGGASDLRRTIMDSKVSVADDFAGILHKRDAELLAELRHFSDKSKKKCFHIVHICTEMAPAISVRSLAPYVTELSCALQRKGHLVEVILPKYASLNLNDVQGLREIEAEFYSYFSGQLHINRIWTCVVHGIGITFIQPIYYSSFFSCERVYGYSNDFERFTYFSRASLDYIVRSGKQPDVIHMHNWQTAIVGPLFWDVFVKQGLGGTRILLTCHGFDSQCIEQPDKLALCGLDPSRLYCPDRLQDNTKTTSCQHFKGIGALMWPSELIFALHDILPILTGGGIVYSNKVIIMSSTHSKGVIIRSLSRGLEPTLALHKDKLLVAPFGFDSVTWNPSMDHVLPQRYSADDMKGKAVCKVTLQRHVGLFDDTSIVLVGCIFSDVLDVDLENLKALVWIASRKGVQFVFMAMRNISGVNRALESLQEEFKDDNVRILKEYDEALSHSIFVGSDIILCQSFDDPVLQVPALPSILYIIYSYPKIKNIRLKIDDDSESTKFSQYISSTFGNVSLSQAIDEIKNNPSQWKRRIMDAMTKDFSWDAECCDIHITAYASIMNL